MGLLSVRPFAGAQAVLAAHGPALPQPDQLCGPFSAWAALHAVLDSPPTVVELAHAAGTRVWPHDEPAHRPAGSTLVTTGWSELAAADTPGESGTDAAGVARAVTSLTDVAVVAAGADDWSGLRPLLADLAASPRPVGVLANVRTGPIASASAPGWDVGHFVVLWGWDAERDEVALADTYPEVGAPGWPPGCRPVTAGALERALPSRGLLLLAASASGEAVTRSVRAHGLLTVPWST